MKANELRIGNRLQSGKYEIIVGPAFFTAFDNYDFENGKVGVLKPEIQPIPLSKEWLLRFGFYFDLKTKYDGYWKKYKEGFEIRIYKFEDYFEYGWQLGHDPIKIMYVHQLQNLYFALTGLELTINPTKEENQ